MRGLNSTAESAEAAEMQPNLDTVTERIIGAAIDVHTELGPGLLESTYEACLVFELTRSGLTVERQKSLPVTYKNVQLDCGYRIDLLVEGVVVVELKAVDHLDPVHEAQLLSYLKLSGCTVGLLINFNVKVLKDGLRRLVLGYSDQSSLRAPRSRR